MLKAQRMAIQARLNQESQSQLNQIGWLPKQSGKPRSKSSKNVPPTILSILAHLQVLRGTLTGSPRRSPGITLDQGVICSEECHREEARKILDEMERFIHNEISPQ